METKLVCPLGSLCETAVDGKVLRCSWFIQVAGVHPQTGETINESRCAIAWLPVLLVENARTNRGQTAALESFRNEAVKGQTVFNNLFRAAITASRDGEKVLLNG